FGVPSPKAVSGKCVKLPEVVTGKIRRVTAVALLIPDRLEPEEQARGVIDDSEELQLMKNGFFVLLQSKRSNHNGRSWNVGEAPFEFRVAEPICCAEGELITDKLVQRDGDCPFFVVEPFAGGRRTGGRIKLHNPQSAVRVGPQDCAREAQVSPSLEPL